MLFVSSVFCIGFFFRCHHAAFFAFLLLHLILEFPALLKFENSFLSATILPPQKAFRKDARKDKVLRKFFAFPALKVPLLFVRFRLLRNSAQNCILPRRFYFQQILEEMCKCQGKAEFLECPCRKFCSMKFCFFLPIFSGVSGF